MPSCFNRNAKHIDQWVVLASGFTERLGDSSGTRTLWRGLRKAYVDEHTAVRLQTWSDDYEQLADLIFAEYRDGKNGLPRIMFAGYSWGGGRAFTQFAEALGNRGLRIDHAVLCDAVYYSWFPSWLIRFCFAVFGGRKIFVPKNVAQVTWFRQTTDKWLRGHEVVAQSSETFIDGPRLLNSDHAHADEQQDYQEAVWAACKEVIE